MNDTTDIKALRDDCTDERMCGACFSGQGICSNQRGCDYLREKLIGIDNEKDLHQFATNLIDQLEAERQRAADLVLHVNTQANMREKAEAELAELKGEQVPVAVLYKTGDVLTREECADDKVFAICCKVETPLYTASPKPVVSDSMAMAFHQALNDGGIGHSDLEEIKVGLRAALGVYDGGIVKDGE